VLCYVNADIILGNDILWALGAVRGRRFVMVAKRRRIDVDRKLCFDKTNNPDAMAELIGAADDFGPANAIDMIVFTRCAALTEMPEFAVGRPAWDNWFIMNAVKHRIPVVDATGMVTVLHQNHGYEHVAESQDGKSWEGPEADENRHLAGGWKNIFTIDDSTHSLTEDGMCAIRKPEKVWRRVERMAMLHPVVWRLCVFWKVRYFLSCLFPTL